MNHDIFETQAAAYVLGALDGRERAEFEAHLAGGCAACEALLGDLRETLVAVAGDEPPRIPPPEVKEALMRRVAASSRGQAGVAADLRRTWLRWALGAAAAMIVGGFLTGSYVAARYEARLGQMARETVALREQLRREQAALRDQLTAYQEVVALLQDPATNVIALRGTGPSPQAQGRVVWNPRAGGRLLVSKLPTAPEGKAYELWTIAGGKPSPAGVFQVDASGQVSHRLEPVSGPVDVFAVTLEPAGGVPAPTGPIVLASAK